MIVTSCCHCDISEAEAVDLDHCKPGLGQGIKKQTQLVHPYQASSIHHQVRTEGAICSKGQAIGRLVCIQGDTIVGHYIILVKEDNNLILVLVIVAKGYKNKPKSGPFG